jgi:hypothetical protein
MQQWYSTHSKQRKWTFVYNDVHIYQQGPESWTPYYMTSNSKRRKQVYLRGTPRQNGDTITGTTPATPTIVTDIELTSCDTTSVKPPAIQQTQSNYEMNLPGDDLTEDEKGIEYLLKSKQITITSDGGKLHDQATYGWMIGDESIIVFEGYDSVPHAASITPFRAEAHGTLAALQYLSSAFEEYNIPIPDIPMMLWIDNQTLIKHIQNQRAPSASECLAPDYEVIASIHEQLTQLPFLTIRYDKSHQKGPDLPIQAIRHNQSDILATCTRNLCIATQESPVHIQSKATLYIQGTNINDKIQTALRHAAYSHHRFENICRRSTSGTIER